MNQIFRSFRHAIHGIGYALKNEHNFQIEALFAILVFILALFFDLSPFEQTTLFLAVGVVLVLELVNTAFERMVDMLKPRVHPYAKIAKDVMAGAVLVAALASFLVGVVIFLPKIFEVM